MGSRLFFASDNRDRQSCAFATLLGYGLLFVALITSGGCSGGGGGESSPPAAQNQSAPIVASIVLTPQNASVPVGQQQQFTAIAKDNAGNTIPGVTVTWSSSNPNGVAATISTDGLATGVSAGSTIIGATIGTVSSGTTLTVTQAVASITITPSAPSIQAGHTQQFTPTATDANGNVVPNVTFTWTSSLPGVASITTNGGLATGVLSGTTTIRAAIGAVNSNPATLTVTPSPVTSITITPLTPSIQVNQSQQFTATAIDGNNQVVPNVTFTWTSSLTGVASITTNGGLATGVSPGATTITATIGPVNSSPATLTVTTPTVQSIGLTPTTASILVNQTQQFTAMARDVFGNVMPNVIFTWVSSSPGVASIDATGFAMAGQSAGTTTITASAGGVPSPGAQLTVTGGGGGGNSYSTSFAGTENPISEGGQWLNGLTTGLDWLDIRTASGVAYGTRTNQVGDAIDPTAILTGTWGWNQTAEAVLFVGSVGANKEVELRLNSLLSPGLSKGYEVLWEITGTITIVRWNGLVGNYTVLAGPNDIPAISSIGGFKTGDVVKATNVNGTITAYVNGVPVLSFVDTTYQAGAPGFGLNTYGGADPTTYGLSRFTASSN